MMFLILYLLSIVIVCFILKNAVDCIEEMLPLLPFAPIVLLAICVGAVSDVVTYLWRCFTKKTEPIDDEKQRELILEIKLLKFNK